MADEQPVLLDPRKVRKESEVNVDLGDGTYITCRKEDMTLLVFEGRVPMPMLAAVQKMIELPNASVVERIEALGVDNGKSLVEVMRQHACKVPIRPKLVMTIEEEAAKEGSLWVEYLDTPRLMGIWQGTAVIPAVGVTAAATFRPRAGAEPADAVQPSPDVPEEPVVVAPEQQPEVVTG